MEGTKMITDSPEQVCSEIRQRINRLADFDGESLKNEMQELKKALLENPAACALLLDEDIGKAVAALRRMTAGAIEASSSSSKKKTERVKKPMSFAELQEKFGSLSEEDLI